MSVKILQGDCREVLKTLESGSMDCCVTDPPYELGFMGKAWDSSGVAYEVGVWREVLRVLKPGGHCLAFGGTRTYHRLACAVEDAGFEIRDQIGWAYGSGFPKSLDVSKALDKAAGAVREVVGQRVTNVGMQGGNFSAGSRAGLVAVTGAAVTGAAVTWQGWGTALKPAWEPIVVARKPLCGTVVENVLKHGTGGINVDGCRIDGEPWTREGMRDDMRGGNFAGGTGRKILLGDGVAQSNPAGRWPANLVHDGSAEVLACFPDDCGGGFPQTRNAPKTAGIYEEGWQKDCPPGERDMGTGSAARFFYCAKAARSDRNEGLGERNTHPTVKPVSLMQWLVRLVCPPGGTVLDPFAGSGSTGKAAEVEGFNSILIEQDAAHVELFRKRTAQQGLFCATKTEEKHEEHKS